MAILYVQPEILKANAMAGTEDADTQNVWQSLAESVSRLFDTVCEVEAGFFAAKGSGVTLKRHWGNNTQYLRLFPYTANSITIINQDGTELYKPVIADRAYTERDGYLIFDFIIPVNVPVDVTALYGFTAIPADIQQACIEMALTMWRRKDLAFTDVSGVSAAVVNAEFSPTFLAVSKRYRELYSSNNYFV